MTKLQVGRPTSSAIAAPGDRYAVSFHGRVLKTIAKVGIESSQFKPRIIELIESLEVDPKQYPLKRGELAGCRAAKVRFADGMSWRAVFRVDEKSRSVFIVALGPHDNAYFDAERRS